MAMELLPHELLGRFGEVGRQGQDPIVIAHFFNPSGAGDWYATEFDVETGEFYGYASIVEGEWGYFSLTELEAYRGPFGLKIERDLYWKERPASQVIPK